MATDFSRLTVVELRQELKRRNLSQAGKKADLVDRLTTFESEQAASEPEDHPMEEAHEAPLEQAGSEAQNGQTADISQSGQDAVSAVDEAPQIPTISDQQPEDAPTAVGGASSAEQPLHLPPQDPRSDAVTSTTTPAEAPSTTEMVTDAVSRKRRSRSPPPENEASRKRLRPDDEQTGVGGATASQGLHQKTPDQDVFKTRPEPTLQTAPDNELASEQAPHHGRVDEPAPAEEHDWRQNRQQSYEERPGGGVDEPMADYDRDVAPAQHPATPALYIKNFMRPLKEPVLQDYLIDLAALPGTAPDPDCLVHFYLDQIRTHAFVSFSSTSAASRVRTALHGIVWPNERNRKELWVDFIPEDKAVEWSEREQSAEGRASSGRWEVRYEPDEDGTITASLVNAEMEPVRRNSTRQPLPPPAVPTGPSRSYPGVEGAPLGPRGRGTNHYRQAQALPAASLAAANERERNEDYGRGGRSGRDVRDGRDYSTTRANPPLQYKPASEEIAERRLGHLKAHITRDRRRDLGRPDEINRYTFEDGDIFVDRGKEAFIGIRPPHRERERRRMGIGPGRGGNRGPPRRRTPSPRRGPRDDGGFRGGGGGGGGGRRDDFGRSYRDRDDDRLGRFRDEPPRSRFDGQPLPTFSGGGGSRGGRWGGGGGGRRDRW
ncbi:uncharacterized protein C8A04DRAFT_14384 [Dichotomopilus funicola]|uniref:SAP domain-containing protein n=1 Tax=Dichotomopilus funicola TaxID=1934379 RepID=A0AAN6UYD8_9PEZI|nr:hypothetical protein C8A04DRAFT_14384 [Dichotomopilus funicola]